MKPGFSSAYTHAGQYGPQMQGPSGEGCLQGVWGTRRTHMLEVELGLLADRSIAVERALDTIAKDLGVHLWRVVGYVYVWGRDRLSAGV